MTTKPSLVDTDLVVVYGYEWCEDTIRARAHFDAAGFSYRYVDMDVDELARALVHGAGYLSSPVVVTPSGSLFMEPADDELAAIMAGHSRPS